LANEKDKNIPNSTTWASANSLVDDGGYEAILYCAACLYMHYRPTWIWKSNYYPPFPCSQITWTHDSIGTHHGHYAMSL